MTIPMETGYERDLQGILDLFRVHQQRVGFVGTVYRSSVTLEEIYTLIEISISPEASVGELCQRLSLPRNSVSRAITALEKRGFIRGEKNPQDGRARIFKLLRKGDEFLELHEKKSRSFVERHLSYLSGPEILELQRFQHRMCDALGVLPAVIRSSEHPFQEGMRRVTRAFGFVGNSLYGSHHSSTEWHILSAIHYSSVPITLSALSNLLDLLPTTLTQMLSRMERNHLLQRKKMPGDRRAKELRLTAQGRAVLERIEQSGREMLKKSFSPQHAIELKRFHAVLAKHLNVLRPSEQTELRPSLQVVPLSREEELITERSFAVYNLVAHGWIEHLSDRLLSPGNQIFALREGEKTQALIELVPGKEMTLVNLCVSKKESLSSSDLSEFIAQALLRSLAINPQTALKMRIVTIPAECYSRLKVAPIDSVWALIRL